VETAFRAAILTPFSDGQFTFLSPLRIRDVERTPLEINKVVSAASAGRMDVIGDRGYGSTDLWWMVAYANRILEPQVVKQGDTIILPPLDLLRSRIAEAQEA